MRLRWVTAGAFGALRDKSLHLGPGLNVIVGPNESGKSTWHAAMYAAICGFPDQRHLGDDDRRFASYRRPKPGTDWSVSAEVEVDAGRVILLHQDLLNPSTSTAHEVVAAPTRAGDAGTNDDAGNNHEAEPGRDIAGQIRHASCLDATRLIGLDRRSFAATAWIEQARTRTALISRDGRNDLQLAVAACTGEDEVLAACARIDALRRDFIGPDPFAADPLGDDPFAADPFAADRLGAGPLGADGFGADPFAEDRVVSGPLARAVAEAQRRRTARDRLSQEQLRRGQVTSALAAARSAADTHRKRLAAAEALAARAKATALREQLRRLRAGFGASSTSAPFQRSTLVAALPPGPGDTDVHPSVAEAERAWREAARAVADASEGRPPFGGARAMFLNASAWLAPLGQPVLAAMCFGGAGLAVVGLLLALLLSPIAGVILLTAGLVAAALGALQLSLLRREASRADLSSVDSSVLDSSVVDASADDHSGEKVKRSDRVPVPSIEELYRRRREAQAALAAALTARGHPTSPATVEFELQRYRARCGQSAPGVARSRQAELIEQERQAAAAERDADHLEQAADPYQMRLVVGEPIESLRHAEEVAHRAVQVQEQAMAGIDAASLEQDAIRQAEIAYAEQHELVSRLRRIDRILRRSRDELARARQDVLREIAAGIATHLGDHLAAITNRPHSIVSTDELTDQIGESLISRQPELGSYSTSEQVFLFTRIELGRHLARGGELGPLLVDDVTSNADDRRVQRILDVLHRVARQRQVVVFAHQEAVAEWARSRLPDDPRMRLIQLISVDEPPVTSGGAELTAS